MVTFSQVMPRWNGIDLLHGPWASIGPTERRAAIDGRGELALLPARRTIVSAITHRAQQKASVGLALCRQRWMTPLSGRQTRIRTAPRRVGSISCFRRRRALANFPA